MDWQPVQSPRDLTDGLEATAVAVAAVKYGDSKKRLWPTVQQHSVPTAGSKVARHCRVVCCPV